MGKRIFFHGYWDQIGCTGEVYQRFIDYAFEQADSFMLVYVNSGGHGYTKRQKYYRDNLKKFKIKSRTDARWPLQSHRPEEPPTTYKVVFYKTHPDAKPFLLEAGALHQWGGSYPANLALFKGNICWFAFEYDFGLAGFFLATPQDLQFAVENGLADQNAAEAMDQWDLFEEALEA